MVFDVYFHRTRVHMTINKSMTFESICYKWSRKCILNVYIGCLLVDVERKYQLFNTYTKNSNLNYMGKPRKWLKNILELILFISRALENIFVIRFLDIFRCFGLSFSKTGHCFVLRLNLCIWPCIPILNFT